MRKSTFGDSQIVGISNEADARFPAADVLWTHGSRPYSSGGVSTRRRRWRMSNGCGNSMRKAPS